MTKDEALRLALEHGSFPQGSGVIHAIKQALEQPEPEPVAWMHKHIDDTVIAHRPADLNRHPERWMALYAEPKSCQTCEALARTVMLDQTSHDTPSKREPLTDEQIDKVLDAVKIPEYPDCERIDKLIARAIEAAHGIKGEA